MAKQQQHRRQDSVYLVPHEEDYEIQCDASTFEKFRDNPLWQDLVGLIKDRIQFLVENMIETTNDAELHRIQGQVQELRNIIAPREDEMDILELAAESVKAESRYREQINEQSNGHGS